MLKFLRNLPFIAASLLFVVASQRVLAQVPETFVYQGQILKNGTTPLEADPVLFRVQILSQTNDCILFEEQHSINMLGSSGVFSLNVGAGMRSGTDYEDTSSLTNVFRNGQLFTVTHCTSGTAYNALANHTRKMRISYNDGSGYVTIAQDFHMQATPFAWYANSLQGLTPTNFVQTNAGQNVTQANLETLLGGTNYTNLLALASGSSPSYVQVGTNGASLPSFSTDPVSPTEGMIWFNQTTNKITFHDGTGIQEMNTSTIDTTKLPLAGGTLTGPLELGGALDAASFDLLNVGHITIANQHTLRLGRYDNPQQTALLLTLGVGHAGTTWYNTDTNKLMYWTGTASREVIDNLTPGGDHGVLTGLGDDDHTQYAALAGRASGQNLRGGTVPSGNLTLESTTDATKGFVILQPNGGNVGIGTTNPLSLLHVSGTVGSSGNDSGFELRDRNNINSTTLMYMNAGAFHFYEGGVHGVTLDASNSRLGIGLNNFVSHLNHAIILGAGSDNIITAEPNWTDPGRDISLIAGSPNSGHNDLDGGKLILSSGGSTGVGESQIEFKTATAGVSGSAPNAPTLKMVVTSDGRVGIGSATPQSLLDVAGIIRAEQICDETGSNCKDISTGWSTGNVSTSRAINTNTGSALTGGGDLSADRNLAVNVDNTGIEIDSNALRLKDLGVSTGKLANTSVTEAKLANNAVTSAKIVDGTIVSADVDNVSIGKISNAPAEYFTYMPAGSECTDGYVLKWTSSDRWECSTDLVGSTDHGALTGLGDDDHTQYALLAGRGAGQNLRGGTAASANLTLESTSDVTKGYVLLQPSGGSVGIGTTAPHASAVMQMASTTKGFLPPRMTRAQRNAIGTPTQGLMVFNTDDSTLDYYSGSAWLSLNGSPKYMKLGMSGVQTVDLHSVVAFDSIRSNGGMTTSANGIQLKAGVTYRLEAAVNSFSSDSSNFLGYQLHDGTSYFGQAAYTSEPENANYGFKAHLLEFYTPIADVTVTVRIIDDSIGTGQIHSAWNTYFVAQEVVPSGPGGGGGNDNMGNHAASQNLALSGFWLSNDGNAEGISISNSGNVGIGSDSPNALLDVAGIVRAQQICDEAGANCKDISTGWGGGGDMDGVTTHATTSGLLGGATSGTADLSVDTDNSTIEISGSNKVRIKDLGVTSAKIADNAITSAKINDGAIMNADINASAAIAWSKIDKTGAAAGDVGAVPSSRTIATSGTSGLSGGGDLTANRSLSVNVDDTTVELNANALRVKDSGITSAKIANGTIVNADIGGVNISKINSAATEYFTYMPNGAECTDGYVLKWTSSNRWECATDIGVTDHGTLGGLGDDDHTQYALLAGRTTGQNLRGGTAANANLTLESTSDSTKGFVLLQPNGGYVGIGVATPTSTLDVAGTINAAGNLTTNSLLAIDNVGALPNGMLFSFRSHGVEAGFIMTYTADELNGDMQFSTQTAGTTTEKMRILANGNVGIGTGVPLTKLDVDGAIKSEAVSNAGTTIDFLTGNIQYTSSSCTGFTLNNLKSGAVYTLIVQGTAGGTCSFTPFSGTGSGSLTLKTGSVGLIQTASTHMVFSFMVAGSYVYVTSVDGY